MLRRSSSKDLKMNEETSNYYFAGAGDLSGLIINLRLSLLNPSYNALRRLLCEGATEPEPESPLPDGDATKGEVGAESF